MFYREHCNLPSSRKAGFTTMEYAILVTALIVALLAAHTYLRRAVSSKWREAADGFSDGRQYKTEGSGQTVITPF